MKTRIALGVEYDGSQFHGWQRQTNACSVQAELEAALSQVANEPITVICAGRTDAGVHATGQVVHFDSLTERSQRAWVFGANTHLHPAVRVLWAQKVPDDFNARRSALSRRYRYIIYNHPIRPSILRRQIDWHYRKLDVQKIQSAAEYWIGQHDFSSFRTSECQSRSPIRQMQAITVARVGDLVILDFRANAFLHHMIRNMVGVLVKIGGGFEDPQWAKTVLEARDRRQASVTATPFGLYLVGVQYPQALGLPEIDAGPWFLQTHMGSELI